MKGPAPRTNDEDIVDEALTLFRANILFASFDSSEPADKVMIYLTLVISQCLRRLEKAKDETQAKKLMFEFSKEKFDIPGKEEVDSGGFLLDCG